MDKFVCTACGYIYEPAIGDPDAGVVPRTKSDKLQEGRVCPVCGVPADQFEKII